MKPAANLIVQYSEYKAARSSACRRQTVKPDGSVRQKAGALTWLLHKTACGIKTSLSDTVKGGPATAAWRFNISKHKHEITVGTYLGVNMLSDTDNTPTRRTALMKPVIAHECAHGAYSDRDIHAAAGLSASKGVPFRLLNLMEDCRIEHLYNAERGKALRFGWEAFDDKVNKVTDNPMSWLYLWKFREPIWFKHRSSVMKPYTWTGTTTLPDGRLTVKVIEEFYFRIIEAPSTLDVVEIAVDWVKIFGAKETGTPDVLIQRTIESTIGGEPDPMGGEPSELVRSTDTTPTEAPKATAAAKSYMEDAMVYPGDVPIETHKRCGRLSPLSQFMRDRRF